MAGNEFQIKARQRKALDIVAAANHFVTIVATNPDERIVVLGALIERLRGDLGPERQENDWEALAVAANRAGPIHYKTPDTTRPAILKLLDDQLRTERAAYRSDPFAGLSVVR